MINSKYCIIEEIPLWEKPFLTLEESSDYFNIGINKVREICDKNDNLVVWNGKKRLIKRKLFEEYIENSDEI